MFMIVLALWFFGSIVIGIAASKHYHRNAFGWVAISLVLGPVLAFLYAYIGQALGFLAPGQGDGIFAEGFMFLISPVLAFVLLAALGKKLVS